MSITPRIPVRTDIDGMATIGRSLNDLRGIRYEDGDGGNAPATPAEPQTPAAPAPATPAAPAEPARPAGENVADLPAWAQKIITDTRKEAGDHRVALTAAEQRTQAILKAAGLAPEEKDPAALLTAAQTTAAQSARELAVYKAAGNIANPLALLDSASFLASVSGIDPTDGPAITAAITAAVAANPNLKAARAAGASSVETPGGTGEQGQITAAQVKTMSAEQIVEAQSKGLLREYMAS
jgi:hypothetical protein